MFESRDIKEENWLRVTENTESGGGNLPKDLMSRINEEGEALNEDLWLLRRLCCPKVKVKT